MGLEKKTMKIKIEERKTLDDKCWRKDTEVKIGKYLKISLEWIHTEKQKQQ